MKPFLTSHWKEGSVALGVFLLVLGMMHIPFFRGIADTFDFRVFRHQSVPPSSDIVVVAMDNETLNNPEFKRFQDISRSDYAQVLSNIMQGSPKVVGVDVFFYNESDDVIEDKTLAQVLSDHPNIVLASEFDYAKRDILMPSSSLGVEVSQTGYINLTSNSYSDSENVNQVSLFRKYGHDAFVVRLLRTILDIPGGYTKQTVPWKYMIGKGRNLPLEEGRAININFFGKTGSYETVSFFDVWNGTVPASFFEDRVVFVGATATDIHDNYFTPTARLQAMPGVEIHAHAFQTIYDEVFLRYYSPLQQWVWVLLGGLILLAALLTFPFWGVVLVLGGLCIGAYILSVFLFTEGVVSSWFWPVLSFLLLTGSIYIVRFFVSEKQKSFLKQTFGRYVSPDVVQKLVDHPETFSLQGEQRQLALWFSDIVNFTTKSESLAPEQVVKVLNIYLEKVTPLILGSGGTIDKFLGDGIMAFWGAPLSVDHSELQACKTALKHQEILKDINTLLEKEGLPALSVRIGLHTDLVNVGNIGTSDRLEYTALGDGVNLASRLEGINKQYGTHILLSEGIVEEAREHLFVRELDTIRVKGKEVALTVFELLALKGKETKKQKIQKETYEQGLDAYRKREWKEAKTWFSVLKEDKASQEMLRRIQIFEKEKKGTDWDGVYTFETK